MRRQGRLRIGTSGYQYDHWKGVFYPDSLPKRRWLEYYSHTFDTVEINNTFYSLPAETTFDQWRESVPDPFVFALKFSRFGSHIKKLKDPGQTISYFLERAERLQRHLGPLLVQLPGSWRPNPERLERFLAQAPGAHRWALEFRDERWLCEEVYSVLEKYNAALCVHDMIPGHPERLTADWIYLRFHGNHYRGRYSSQYLTAWAQRIRDYLHRGCDVYVYFNNDDEGHAVQNARDLRRYLKKG